MRKFLLIAAPGVLLLMSACLETTGSKNVKSDAVYQTYTVTYVEDDSSLETSAQFLVGGALGTTLELESPSRVTFDGKDLRRESFLGTHYVGNWKQLFESTHSWEWIDQDGKSYVNAMTIVPIHIEKAPDVLTKSGAYTITVSGAAFAPEDRFSLEVSQSIDGSLTWTTLAANVQGSDAVTVDVKASTSGQKYLKKGPATVKLLRVRSSGIQQGTKEGGSISSTYVTHPFKVEVIE